MGNQLLKIRKIGFRPIRYPHEPPAPVETAAYRLKVIRKPPPEAVGAAQNRVRDRHLAATEAEKLVALFSN